MFNNNNPYGGNQWNTPYGGGNQRYGRGNFGSSYQYQTLPYGSDAIQASSLMSKVLALLSVSFIFASIGAFMGIFLGIGGGSYLMIVIAGFVVLFALQFLIQKPGINLFLLFLFTFLEGMGLAPILGSYLYANGGANQGILAEAFILTAITTLLLSVYAWTTKRDFSRMGDYLFFGLLLLIVVGILGFLFQGLFSATPFALLISFFGIAIFSGFVLYYIQRAKYMANTTPNAIGMTVSIFLTVINLFLYILMLLSILGGGSGRRR
ncbi:MAG TPA: Bax inhibitor-1 family protein [Ktedonobacteraceae bacterium]|jgi:modulator of FtsH protease|nr:Bax inhibitor-1 family protein [Ktedonobacteraceae bacterium]